MERQGEDRWPSATSRMLEVVQGISLTTISRWMRSLLPYQVENSLPRRSPPPILRFASKTWMMCLPPVLLFNTPLMVLLLYRRILRPVYQLAELTSIHLTG